MIVMSDDSTTYQANSIAAAVHCLRLLWAHSTDGDIPNPETDHRIGLAFSGFLSDDIIAGHEEWAVPLIVGTGAGWHTYLEMDRANRTNEPDAEGGDDNSTDDDNADAVVDDSDAPIEEGEDDDGSTNRSGYRRRRRK